jgi:hypothetical protein
MGITISDPVIRPAPGMIIPPPTVVQAARQLVRREGLARAQAILRMSRGATERLIAGNLPVRLGTVAWARETLSALDPSVEP